MHLLETDQIQKPSPINNSSMNLTNSSALWWFAKERVSMNPSGNRNYNHKAE